MATDALLDKHAALSDELAQLLRELGDVRSVMAAQRAEIWNQTADLSVTERRETVSAHTADLTGDIERLLGEVEALRVLIHHLDQRITYRTVQ